MAIRKGLGRGTGKGYRNIIGKDPRVHSDSGKGRKQPQRINPTIRTKLIKDPIAKLRGKQIVIKGRRWFDSVNGNTYHSTEVYVDGKLVGRESFTYGYGDQYYQTGKEILADKGFIEYERTKETVPVFKQGKIDYHTPKESQNKSEAFSKFEDYRRAGNYEKVLTFVDDVSRKKDL